MTSRAPGGGRKPKPTALKLLQGNPGKRALSEDEPKLPPHLPSPPRELSPRAKREWKRLGRQLLEMGVVTEVDQLALAALVQSYARWIDIQANLARTSLMVRGQDGTLRLNPLLRASRDAQFEYTRMLTEFGMTPSSRGRVHAEKPEEEDEFEALMRRRQQG